MLTIKNEYKYAKIVRKVGLLDLLFDTENTSPDKYQYFHDNGFKDVFETKVEKPNGKVIEYKGVPQDGKED